MVTGLGPSVGIRVVFKLVQGLSPAVCLLGIRGRNREFFASLGIMGFGCSTCIGNSGPLPEPGEAAPPVAPRSAPSPRARCWCWATTSPATSSRARRWIDRSSAAGTWPIERGGDPKNLNVCASYRGHWEGMLRGRFTNRSANSQLSPDLPLAHLRAGGSEVLKLHKAAVRFEA